MKKLFLLLILVLTIKGFGQTYSVTIKYSANGAGCHAAGYDWSLYGNTSSIGSFSSGGNNMNIPITYKTYTVGNYTSFKLNLSNSCIPLGAATKDCDQNKNKTLTNIELIKGLSLGLSGCNGNASVFEFKPNINIKNQNPTNSNTVCSGEQLELAGFPIGFPDEAYHWQYSKDDQVTWIDVPSSIGSNPKTNNTPVNAFSINDLLGSNSEQYYNKQIYFRLGYSQNRPFTDPIPMTYSACAPVITNLNPIQPNCSGDPMTVIVTFDRPLDPDKNEKLTNFQIIKKTGELTGNQIPEILVFDTANTLQYTYNNVKGLENGKIYTVKYQAFQGVKERGVPETDKDFPYQDPKSFYFTAKATPAICNGAKGAIEILAWGGSSPYRYILDSGAVTPFENSVAIVEGTISKQKVVIEASSTPNPNVQISTNHSIIVTDDKGCIDKTANQ